MTDVKRLITLAVAVAVGALVVAAPALVTVNAQNRMNFPLVASDGGHVALGLAIRRLNVSGTFLQTAAHPDDEHNQLYALFTLGQGLRSVDVQTTRGAGGQNEIGPELFQDLAVLRTSELMSAHRLDGAEQYFTRAIDFGYSFDPPEIYKKWGRQEVVADFVRLIRMFRPDVVLTMSTQGTGGDRAHEATTMLTQEAFKAAGDPAQFPEQIKAGLRPWSPKKLYFTPSFGRGGGPAAPGAPGAPPAGQGAVGGGRGAAQAVPPGMKLATIDTNVYDTLLGRTYAEIGADARSNHKCQGMSGLPPLPSSAAGGRGGRYQLIETSIASQKDKDEPSLFEGIDVRLAALAQFAGPNPPEALKTGLAAVVEQAELAQKAFDTGNDAGTVAPIVTGLAAVRTLRSQLGSMGLSDTARYEIDFRLNVKEQDYQNAVLAAHGLTFDAVSDDGLLIVGQPVKVTLLAINRGPSDVELSELQVAGFDGQAGCAPGLVKKNTVYSCTADLKVPQAATLTTPYWKDEYWNVPNPKLALDIPDPDVPFGLPFRPTPFRAAFKLKASGAAVAKDVPVAFRYVKDLYHGDKRMELNVVPAFSVETTPTTGIVPAGGGARSVDREIYVSITSGVKGPAEASVKLQVPAGWKVSPPATPVSFSNEDQSLTVRFTVTVPPGVKLGEYVVKAVVTSPAIAGAEFTSGYHVIEYPHIQRRQVIKPAETDIKVMSVNPAPSVRVGYIIGAGDQVPAALEQLGAKVEYIEPDELAWGDLSKYEVIVTGTRAYQRRPDLRAYNRRLIEYADRGGTVIVQYNKMEFNQAQYGPYPARVSNSRVTDENGPVKILVPNDRVFNVPNKIGEDTWKGWVQERGLYFLGEKDPKYVDLLSVEEPFPDNKGVKTGALVSTTVGKGRWLYVGLGLWRQAPAQTEGAYQLLANLIALGKAAPATKPATSNNPGAPK
jgi:LmbE family N-acetylglucosaminyl deacetylase